MRPHFSHLSTGGTGSEGVAGAAETPVVSPETGIEAEIGYDPSPITASESLDDLPEIRLMELKDVVFTANPCRRMGIGVGKKSDVLEFADMIGDIRIGREAQFQGCNIKELLVAEEMAQPPCRPAVDTLVRREGMGRDINTAGGADNDGPELPGGIAEDFCEESSMFLI